MILFLAAPAGAEPRLSAPAVRDVVIRGPSAASARISAGASTQRYPVNDGTGATTSVAITASCQASCPNADPQQIANFVGTLMHGPEIELLTIQLDTPFQLGLDCGFEAEACYYSGQNKIVISGENWTGIGGATREYVIAHEYGHHVAQHRNGPAPFPAAIDWGPPHWASYQHVCERTRAGALFPRDAGEHYFEHPGEAFAESFARYHFRDLPVRWRWTPLLKPTHAAFRAIREDTLSPWRGRESFTVRGRFPPRRAEVRWLRTPLDGQLSIRPTELRRRGYEVALRDRSGRTLRTSRQGLSPNRPLSYTVCGQSRLGLAIKPTRRSGGAFELRIQRP
jgi:hypothetical protein